MGDVRVVEFGSDPLGGSRVAGVRRAEGCG
jgi:hypothetical protein